MASTQTPSRKKAKDAKLNELIDPPPASQFGESGEPVTVVKTLTGGIEFSASGKKTAHMVMSVSNKTTVLGDSTMAYAGAATGSNAGLTSQGLPLWANDHLAETGNELDIVSWRAVGGVTLQQVIDTQLVPTLSDNTAIAWDKSGVNNFGPSAGLTLAEFIADKSYIIGELSRNKDFVIIDAMTPLLQSGSTGAKARAFQLPAANAAMAEICARYNNVLFNDVYSDIVDPSSDNLDALAGTLRTDDGIHQVTYGARLQGHGTARRLMASKVRPVSSRVVGANLLPAWGAAGGGSSIPNGATVTGRPPSGYTVIVTPGGAGMAVTFTDLGPDMIRMVITNANAGNQRVRVNVADGALLAAAVAGAVVRGGVGFQASGIAGLLQLNSDIVTTGTGAIQWNAGVAGTNEPTVNYGTKAFGGRRQTLPLTLAAAPASVTFNVVDVIIAASTGAVTIDMYAPNFNVLT